MGHRGQALKLSSDEIAYLARLVDAHMRPTLLAQEDPPSRRAIYRFYHDLGDAGPDCTLLSLADSLAMRAAQPDIESWRRRQVATSLHKLRVASFAMALPGSPRTTIAPRVRMELLLEELTRVFGADESGAGVDAFMVEPSEVHRELAEVVSVATRRWRGIWK